MKQDVYKELSCHSDKHKLFIRSIWILKFANLGGKYLNLLSFDGSGILPEPLAQSSMNCFCPFLPVSKTSCKNVAVSSCTAVHEWQYQNNNFYQSRLIGSQFLYVLLLTFPNHANFDWFYHILALLSHFLFS